MVYLSILTFWFLCTCLFPLICYKLKSITPNPSGSIRNLWTPPLMWSRSYQTKDMLFGHLVWPTLGLSFRYTCPSKLHFESNDFQNHEKYMNHMMFFLYARFHIFSLFPYEKKIALIVSYIKKLFMVCIFFMLVISSQDENHVICN